MVDLRERVEKFYRVLWDAHDKEAIPELLATNFVFRGSLGEEKRGHDGFAEYVDMVHRALDEYRCTINELVIEAPRAFARMTFSGIHRNSFSGFPPTGKRLTWVGCALFTFAGEKISDVWVLGDLHGLERLLKQNEP